MSLFGVGDRCHQGAEAPSTVVFLAREADFLDVLPSILQESLVLPVLTGFLGLPCLDLGLSACFDNRVVLSTSRLQDVQKTRQQTNQQRKYCFFLSDLRHILSTSLNLEFLKEDH